MNIKKLIPFNKERAIKGDRVVTRDGLEATFIREKGHIIMTPKEKAEQLVNRFKERGYTNEKEIKEMALIVANEVTEQWEYIDTYLADLEGQLNPNLKYWYEVIGFLNAL